MFRSSTKLGILGYEYCPRCGKRYDNIIYDTNDLKALRRDDVCADCKTKRVLEKESEQEIKAHKPVFKEKE